MLAQWRSTGWDIFGLSDACRADSNQSVCVCCIFGLKTADILTSNAAISAQRGPDAVFRALVRRLPGWSS